MKGKQKHNIKACRRNSQVKTASESVAVARLKWFVDHYRSLAVKLRESEDAKHVR